MIRQIHDTQSLLGGEEEHVKEKFVKTLIWNAIMNFYGHIIFKAMELSTLPLLNRSVMEHGVIKLIYVYAFHLLVAFIAAHSTRE